LTGGLLEKGLLKGESIKSPSFVEKGKGSKKRKEKKGTNTKKKKKKPEKMKGGEKKSIGGEEKDDGKKWKTNRQHVNKGGEILKIHFNK